MISVRLQTDVIKITLPHGCSPVNLFHICRAAVLTNTCGELLLQIFIQHTCHIFKYKFVSNLVCFLIYFWIVQELLQSEQSFVFQNFLCSYSNSFDIWGIVTLNLLQKGIFECVSKYFFPWVIKLWLLKLTARLAIPELPHY